MLVEKKRVTRQHSVAGLNDNFRGDANKIVRTKGEDITACDRNILHRCCPPQFDVQSFS